MNRQAIAQMLLIVISLQSCVAYQKTSIPINKASNAGRVKVIDTGGVKFIFNNIEVKEGVYYGIKGDEVLIIDTALISEIYLKDHKKSTWQTVLLITGITVSFLFYLTVGVNAYANVAANKWIASLLVGGI